MIFKTREYKGNQLLDVHLKDDKSFADLSMGRRKWQMVLDITSKAEDLELVKQWIATVEKATPPKDIEVKAVKTKATKGVITNESTVTLK